jgi:hypothetical protein
MSIPVEDVLERILSDVSGARDHALDLQVFRAEALRDPRRNATAGIATGASSGPGAFATNLHFWATGLLAFMGERGSERSFMQSAERCLCRPMEMDEVATQIDRFFSLLVEPHDLDPVEGTSGGYRMFEDGNRRSILVETPMRYVGFYWQNDTLPPAFDALLRALFKHTVADATHTVADAGDPGPASCIMTQQDVDLAESRDAVYAWRIAGDSIERLDPDSFADAAKIRFVFDAASERLVYAWRDAQGVLQSGACWIRGEGAQIELEEASP